MSNNKPTIEFYNPEEPVKKAIAELRKQQRNTKDIMIAVIVIVSLGFITLIIAVFGIFISHQDYSTQKYKEYIDLVEKEKTQIRKEASTQNCSCNETTKQCTVLPFKNNTN